MAVGVLRAWRGGGAIGQCLILSLVWSRTAFPRVATGILVPFLAERGWAVADRRALTARSRQLLAYGRTRFAANFLALMSVQVAGYLLPLLTVPYLVRTIGLERLGVLAFAQSLIAYFNILTDYGFNLSATRKVALSRHDPAAVGQILGSVLVLKFCMLLVSLTILAVLLLAFQRFRDLWPVYLIAFGEVVGNALFPVWLFQGLERMKFITILNLLAKMFFALSIFAFVHHPEDYLLVPASTAAGSLIVGILALAIVLRYFGLRPTIGGKTELLHFLREGWHIFISTVSVSAYTTSRLFAVGLFTNPVTTGFYMVAERLMAIVQLFPWLSLLSAAYPRLAELHAKNPGESLRVSRKLQQLTTSAHLLILPLIFLLAPRIAALFAGAAHQEIVVSFRLLLVAVFLINANAFRIQFLLVSNRADVYSRIHMLAGACGVIVIFFCTYLLSYRGAACAIICVELAVLLLTLKYAPRATGVKP
jgi:polysaccharide transporter, PST family